MLKPMKLFEAWCTRCADVVEMDSPYLSTWRAQQAWYGKCSQCNGVVIKQMPSIKEIVL